MPVAGATGATFTPGAGDVGKTVTVAVTGTRNGYEPTTETSEPTAPVALGDLAETPEPQLTGVQRVGRDLQVQPGVFDGDVSVQWVRGITPIDGETSDTYSLVPADARKRITARVTYSRPGYTSVVERTSTGAVQLGVQELRPRPDISGRPRVGSRLTAMPGAHDPGTRLTYQWLVGGRVVHGATTRVFVPTDVDRGKRVQVRVVSSKPGYLTLTKTSTATAKVR